AACEIPASMDFRREGDDWVAYGKAGESQARMIAGATYFSQTDWPMAGEDWHTQLERLPEHMGKVCWAGLAEPLYDDGLSEANLQRIAEHVRGLRQTSQ